MSNKHINDSNESGAYVRQHLIDPELCLACGGCQSVCPEKAIEMDFTTMRYAIDPDLCTGEQECLSVCSSEAIKAWRMVPTDQMHSLAEQFNWEALPPEIDAAPALDAECSSGAHPAPVSAAIPVSYLYTRTSPVAARIQSNTRITGGETDIHHIVLDFGDSEFPWLEGQNLGILPAGEDVNGRPYPMRAYSIASERDGESIGTRRLALTIKRVVDEWQGQPYYGIASNYICDLAPGSEVRCVGPIGEKFLMPADPDSRILMICTGTGIAPMRSFIQRRQRMAQMPRHPLVLFYGGRTPGEMAYYDELRAAPASLLDVHMALSRVAGESRQYVQDKLLAQADVVAQTLASDSGYIFLCGLIGMEQGVMAALAEVASRHGMDWLNLQHEWLRQGRLQIETY